MSADARYDELDSTLNTMAVERDFSGTVLLTHAGETLFEGCYGLADRAADLRITPRTRFGLASVTKLFTTVAAVDLVDAGRMSFDDPIVDLLPADRRPSTLRPDVTVHHLLTHTSGIADYAEEDDESPAYVEDYGALWTDLPVYGMLRPDDFLPMFGDLEPYRPPGETWQYSNAGFILLGIVIEQVADRPYIDFVQERVFDRAGMTASGFFRLDDAVPDVAVGYLPRTSPDELSRTNIYRIPVVGGPDGGAFSTGRDLDRFLTELSEGDLLGAVRETALTPRLDVIDDYRQGYGVLIYPDGRISHGGGDPGVSCLIHRWRREATNLVVLCNVEDVVSDVRNAAVDAWRG
jgi:CubicO group peptidase (beta-lactamase class C family)